MTIKGDTLYALGNSFAKNNNESVLLLINIQTQKIVDSYTVHNTGISYLNDLTISVNNQIFITDSESDKVYTIQRPDKQIAVFLDTPAIAHSNGIAISTDNNLLYLASDNGIRIIDINTKQIINSPNKAFAGIDGLKYYKHSLIGIVNSWRSDTSQNGVFRYILNAKGTSIERKEKIISFDDSFKQPTTFDIANDYIYFIKNTQIDNFDEHTNAVIDTTKLEQYVLMKKHLD